MIDLASIVRSVALDLAPLMADRDLVFDIETTRAGVACHEWMLGELTRNLLHNAIKYPLTVARCRFACRSGATTPC